MWGDAGAGQTCLSSQKERETINSTGGCVFNRRQNIASKFSYLVIIKKAAVCVIGYFKIALQKTKIINTINPACVSVASV